MVIPLLLQGILIGIIISIPLGPVGIITMKRTAEFGLRAGIVSSFAIVLIDTIAAILILVSFHHFLPYMKGLSKWMQALGGLILFIYGVRLYLKNPQHIEDDLPWHKHFFASAIIALTNPSTYFSFGVTSILLSRFIDEPSFARAEVAIGFFIGALLWWCTLAFITFTHRNYLNAKNLQKIVGGIIMALALGTILGIVL
jgi:threonine/homoserine/homoserine lactone efflux protein